MEEMLLKHAGQQLSYLLSSCCISPEPTCLTCSAISCVVAQLQGCCKTGKQGVQSWKLMEALEWCYLVCLKCFELLWFTICP